MNATANDLHFRKILVGGIVAFILSFVIVVAIIAGYATWLGFEARGQPDEARIEAFAEAYAPVMGAIFSILVAFLGGRWISKRVTSRAVLHGALLGAIIALLGIGTDLVTGIAPRDLLAAIGIIAAGWLGASTATRVRSPQ